MEYFTDAKNKLTILHNKLTINHGSFEEEYPEQLLAMQFINYNDKVLELGGNIGRNSLIISSILSDSSNLLVFEPDPDNVLKLIENKNLNNLNFLIENSAISKTKIYQKDWYTIPLEKYQNLENFEYWKEVKTITWTEVKNKYNILFDVLVADCEGALYYILQNEEFFLDSFKTIIIENDFIDINHKIFVDKIFHNFNFKKIFSAPLIYGFELPCVNNFFEVWQR